MICWGGGLLIVVVLKIRIIISQNAFFNYESAMQSEKANVLERNMGVIKEMLLTLPHFQGCKNDHEQENEQLRERNTALIRESKAQLGEISDLEQSCANLKQENEILRIKLAQNEALVKRLRAKEGSEGAMRQLANEVKSYKTK